MHAWLKTIVGIHLPGSRCVCSAVSTTLIAVDSILTGLSTVPHQHCSPTRLWAPATLETIEHAEARSSLLPFPTFTILLIYEIQVIFFL